MTGNFGYGHQEPADSATDYNVIQFIINQTLLRVRTITLVKVLSVKGSALSPPVTVSVQSLINMLDGQGNSTPHGTIFNVPVFVYGSGNGSIICDPVVGEYGIECLESSKLQPRGSPCGIGIHEEWIEALCASGYPIGR